jgi:hypothetical protein
MDRSEAREAQQTTATGGAFGIRPYVWTTSYGEIVVRFWIALTLVPEAIHRRLRNHDANRVGPGSLQSCARH